MRNSTEATTLDYTIYDYYYEMGDNSTQNVSDVSIYTTMEPSTFDTSPPYGRQVPRDYSEGEGQFLVNVMIAVAGTISFIVLVTATCFIYRSRKRARLNMRRVRSRSRPGVLSLELLERDLIQSAISQAAHQPLYGVDTAETTTISEVSSSVVREEFHNRSTRSKKQSVDNGTSPNVEQTANHIQQGSERIEEKDALLSESDKTSHTYQNVNNTDARNSQESKKEALKPPIRKESGEKKIPPKVAKKPSVKTRDQRTISKDESGENELDKNSLKQRNISTTSSDYENPDGVINIEHNTGGTMLQISEVKISQIGRSKSGAKLPRPPIKSIKESGNEDGCSSNSNREKDSEKKNTFVLDINITIPPPSPCSNKPGYVNTQCESPDEVFHTTGPKHGYVNMPNSSNSSKKDTRKTSADVKGEKTSPKLRKAGSVEPPEIGYTNEYVNLKRDMSRRGYNSAPFLPAVSGNNEGGKLTSSDLEHGYVRMGECQEDDIYIPMGLTKSQEAVYLDMSSGKYAGLGSDNDSTGCYANADVSSYDSKPDTGSYGYVNADPVVNGSKQDKGYDYGKADANANCFKQDNEYVNADASVNMKGPSVCKGESHEYVNTTGDDTNGYALPRAATYKVVGGTPRHANTARSKSTDNVYDYAVLKGINGNLKS